MMSNIEILSIDDKINWNNYLKKLPYNQQDIYYTPEYYQLYEDLGDGKALCFVYEKDGELAMYPFLKNEINSLGYTLDKTYYDIQGAYGYNGVISSSINIDFINSFNNVFKTYIDNENIIAEFTRFHPIIKNALYPIDMIIIKDRKTVCLNLSETFENIWNKQYSNINRNMIRKALKNEIEVSIVDSNEDWASFVDIYQSTMQNIEADKYYFFSNSYFENIKTNLVNNHKLFIAKKGGVPICGMILLFNNYYAHYHLSGRLREFANTGVNNLVLDVAIKYAINYGCKYFHFGGGTTRLENDSLLKFKSNFSKEYADFFIGKRIHNQIIYNEVVRQWENKFPEKLELNKNLILKYRE